MASSGILRIFTRAPPHPSRRGIRFLDIDVYFRRVSLPRRYRQTPSSRSSLFLFPPLSFFLSSPVSLSQTALGCNALRFRCLRTSCRAMRINHAPICRYAQSTRTPLQRGGNAWYFANRLNALLNDADTRQTPCLTNAIIVTQYYYISGANVLRC